MPYGFIKKCWVDFVDACLAQLKADVATLQGTPATLSLNGNTLTVTSAGGSSSVDLSQYLDNTDDQLLAVGLSSTGFSITIQNGNTVSVGWPPELDEQTISLNGSVLTISNGNSIDLSGLNTDDQQISFSNGVLTLEDGGSVVIPDNDNQILAVSVTQTPCGLRTDAVSISNSGSTVPIHHQCIQVVPKTIYEEYYAGGSNNQNLGGDVWERNVTISRIATGRPLVVFDTPHADGDNYHISMSVAEPANTRDVPKISWVPGTKTANGFELQITYDDNGGNADPYTDEQWSFSVSAPCELVGSILIDGQLASIGSARATGSVTPTGQPNNGELFNDNFQDGGNNAPFDLQVRNTTGNPVGWEAVVSAVPYATIPNLSAGNYTVQIQDNGDGTYTYLFSGTQALPAYGNIRITGDAPVPAGNNNNGAVTLYVV